MMSEEDLNRHWLKPSLLQLSLGVSLLFHLAVFGVVSLVAGHAPNLLPPQDGEVLVLTLVSAPAEAEPAVPPSVESFALPRPVAPVETKTVEHRAPEESAPVSAPLLAIPDRPSGEISEPAPLAIASPLPHPPDTGGKSGAPLPGNDEKALKAPPGIKAQPSYGRNPEPLYPPAARRRRQEGLVLLVVSVNAQGRAAAVRLKQSSGFVLLDEAALQAVRGWEFQPARLGLIAVASETEVPIRFRLSE